MLIRNEKRFNRKMLGSNVDLRYREEGCFHWLGLLKIRYREEGCFQWHCHHGRWFECQGGINNILLMRVMGKNVLGDRKSHGENLTAFYLTFLIRGQRNWRFSLSLQMEANVMRLRSDAAVNLESCSHCAGQRGRSCYKWQYSMPCNMSNDGLQICLSSRIYN